MTEIKMLAGNTNSAFFPILFIKYNSNNSSREELHIKSISDVKTSCLINKLDL
jgi:hypothetical protein